MRDAKWHDSVVETNQFGEISSLVSHGQSLLFPETCKEGQSTECSDEKFIPSPLPYGEIVTKEKKVFRIRSRLELE